MMTAREFLNRIRWHPDEYPSDYIIHYYDRPEKRLRAVPYKEIMEIDRGFLTLIIGGRETNVPLHRIRKIERRGKIVWERTLNSTTR